MLPGIDIQNAVFDFYALRCGRNGKNVDAVWLHSHYPVGIRMDNVPIFFQIVYFHLHLVHEMIKAIINLKLQPVDASKIPDRVLVAGHLDLAADGSRAGRLYFLFFRHRGRRDKFCHQCILVGFIGNLIFGKGGVDETRRFKAVFYNDIDYFFDKKNTYNQSYQYGSKAQLIAFL